MPALAEIPGVHPNQRPYQPFGAARDLFYCRDTEVLLDGPAGTGKSRAVLEKVHLCALKYAGMRALLCRKTRTSMTQTTLVTFEQKVVPFGSSIRLHTQDQEYRYPNGSTVVVGGLDKPSKIMSAEFDMIYVQEATEATERDWEFLLTRLRNGVMPYQQLLGDCNPDSPFHWLYQRWQAGRLTMLHSRHTDNPAITDAYLATLGRLTGHRLQRLRDGLWVSAEGLVFADFDPAVHLVDRVPLPRDWPRIWVVDFGYTHPFVWQCWAIDGDGRLWREHEIYMTGRLVEDHAEAIIRTVARDAPPEPGNPDYRMPVAIICDHDAEDRATLERHLGYQTTPAVKAVSPGIQAVQARLRIAGDGKPRLFLLRDALVEADPALSERHHPLATEYEFPSYVWDTREGRARGEAPVKDMDHGMDCLRYLVATLDIPPEREEGVVVYHEPVKISPY